MFGGRLPEVLRAIRHRRAPALITASLLMIGGGVAGCGGSNTPSGVVNAPVTVGSGTSAQEVNPAAGLSGSQLNGPVGNATPAANTTPTPATSSATTPAGGGAGDATAGKARFTALACGSCHTLKAAGGSGTIGPNFDQLKISYQLVLSKLTNPTPRMQTFMAAVLSQMTPADKQNLAAYISSVAGK